MILSTRNLDILDLEASSINKRLDICSDEEAYFIENRLIDICTPVK